MRTRKSSTQSPARSPWGRFSWRLVLYAVWFTPLMPSVLLLRAFHRRHRGFRWFLLGLGLWGLGELWVLTRAIRWELLAVWQVVWSVVGGVGCAVAAQAAARAGWLLARAKPSGRAAEAPRISWLTSVGCGLLVYCLVLTSTAVVWMIGKLMDWSAREVLLPSLLLWVCPGLILGVALGVLWQRRGAVTARLLTNFLVGMHLLVLGTLILILLLQWVYGFFTPPDLTQLYVDEQGLLGWSLAVLFAPLIAYSYYVGLAPRIAGVLARTLVCLTLFLANFIQLAAVTGDQGLIYRDWAIRDERSDDAATRLAAVRHWQRYLAVFPDTTERPEALWRMATTLARLGRRDAARQLFGVLAELPDDAGEKPHTVRYAKLLLTRSTAGGRRNRVENASVSAIEHAKYLDDGWRSALSFLRSGQPELPMDAFMAKLRALSLDPKHLVLPPLTNLFEVKAYGRLLGVEVVIRPRSLGQIKSILASGQPVLIRRQDRWMCLMGFDPGWGTLLYYDYGRETDRLRARHQQAETKAIFSDSEAKRRERLRLLQQHLIEECPEEDVVQALTDQHGLAATIRSADEQDDVAVQWFLLGELAFDAKDPLLALRHYAGSLASAPKAAWVLPSLHVARLTIEQPPLDIVERRLVPQDLVEGLTQWKREQGHEELLARAKAAFEDQGLDALPAHVLERLGALLRVNVPGDRAQLIRCYDILHQRYPEHVPYLTTLSEAYHHEGAVESVAAASRRLSVLEPAEATYPFRLAESLLKLQRPAEARAVLKKASHLMERNRPRYLALSGRAARLLHQPRRAVRCLRQALETNLADPELRYELAMTLEELGRHDQALREWKWVAFATLDPTHRQASERRLMSARVGAGR